MKKLYFLTLLLFLFSAPVLKSEVLTLNNPEVSTAIDQALKQAGYLFRNAQTRIGKKNIAILPVASDPQGYFTGKLKNLITNSGCNLVEARQDPAWNKLLEEIGWTAGKDDILDETTIAKFGRLKGVQVLFTASFQVNSITGGYCVQLDFHATDVATREHIWGDNLLYRHYIDDTQQGMIKLDNQIRELLKENFALALASLKENNAVKNQKVKVAAVLPFGGDIDGYITEMCKELLTTAGLETQKGETASTLTFRINKKNDANAPQGYFYGTVRDLSRKLKETTTSDETITTTWEVSTDIQLTLADTKTGNGYWHKTISLKKDMSESRKMTKDELIAHCWEQFIKFCCAPFRWIGDNPGTAFLALGIAVGAAVLLVLLLIAVKFFISNKFIR